MKLIEFKSANKYSFAYSFPRKNLKEIMPGVYYQYRKQQKKEFTVHE